MTDNLIYKICTAAEWAEAERQGQFTGSAVDLADGFIHFSTAQQLTETARRHFAGRSGLVLVAVDTQKLPSELRWEKSRGGDMFPHLYAPLPTSAATEVTPLPLDNSGMHNFPDLLR